MSLLLPPGLKVKGANIVPTPVQVDYNGGSHAWTQFYGVWSWPWIKNQIDHLSGNGIGANCFRAIGGAVGVVRGDYSQAVYTSRLLQLATYCRDKGVYFYAGCTGLDNDTDYVSTPQALASAFAPSLLAIQGLGNVIAVDVLQEAQTGVFPNSYLIALMDGLRAAGVTLPLTCSSSQAITNAAGSPWINAIAPFVDFLDIHVYAPPAAGPLFDYLRTTFPTKEILVGEFGRHQNYTSADRNSFLSQVWNLALPSNDEKIRGALAWAATDQSTNPEIQYGLFTEAFIPRQQELSHFRRVTGGSLAKSKSVLR